MADSIESNLFESESALIIEARQLIKNSESDKNDILDKFSIVIEQFYKLVRDAEKIIKISDGQQEYLHRIQHDLKKEIEDRIRAEEKLKYLAAIDTLTETYNRGMGLTLLENEVNTIRRKQGVFSICYIDVNKLKYVNDNYGHFEGDELLVTVCEFIKKVIRHRDILCRLGGDEFIILFPDMKKENAETIINKIIENLEDENRRHNKPYNISFSYGIIQVDGNNDLKIDTIIQKADAIMYEYKQNINKKFIFNSKK